VLHGLNHEGDIKNSTKPKTQNTAATTKTNEKNKPQSTGFIYLLVSKASELQLY